MTTWLLTGCHHDQDIAQELHQDESLLGVVGWLLENQIYDRSLTSLKIDSPLTLFGSHANPVEPDKLYLTLQPVKPLSDDIFHTPPSWSKLTILLIYAPKQNTHCLKKVEFLALNSWGELFVHGLTLETQNNIWDTYEAIALKITQYRSINLRLFFFQMAFTHDPDAVFMIKQHLAARSQTLSGTPGSANRKRPLLDRL